MMVFTKYACEQVAVSFTSAILHVQAQTGLEDPCDSVEQAAPPGAARPLKRLKRAVDVAAAGSPEPPPTEAVPKSQQKSRLMPASFEAQAAAAPCEAEKASNPFVSEKSVQKNLQVWIRTTCIKPSPQSGHSQ